MVSGGKRGGGPKCYHAFFSNFLNLSATDTVIIEDPEWAFYFPFLLTSFKDQKFPEDNIMRTGYVIQLTCDIDPYFRHLFKAFVLSEHEVLLQRPSEPYKMYLTRESYKKTTRKLYWREATFLKNFSSLLVCT